MNINNFNIKKYIKRKGEKTMVNRVNKKLVIILLFTMLFTMLVPKEVSAATYTKKNSLYSAGKNAVGRTVRIYRSGHNVDDNNFIQDQTSSHIYCIQHHVATTEKYYDYKVQNYIKIEGNVATNSSGKSVTSNANLVLGYLLDKENWKKGYGGTGDEEVRNLAIKHYMTAGGWMVGVGSKLGISSDHINYFNINTSNKSSSKKKKVNDFLKRAKEYAKTNASKKTPATIKLAPSSLKPTTLEKLGPVKLTFTGNLQSIKLYNGNKEVKDIKSYTVGGNTKTLAQINTGNNVTINRKTENKVTKIEASVKSGTYISAELWICVKSNAKQNLMITRAEEKTNSNKASIKVGNLVTGNLTIKKIDQDTQKALSAGFKIQTSAGTWVTEKNGTYTYNNAYKDASKFTSPRTIKGLKLGTYKVYEVSVPKDYDIKAQTGYDAKNGWVYFGTVTLSTKTASVVKTYKNKSTSELKITKLDRDTNKPLSAGFKIQTSSGKWLKGTNGSYTYNNDYDKAQEYTSPVSLKSLAYGTYKIYEVSPPQNYDLASQEGYDKKNNWVPFGAVTINANNSKVEKKCTNAQRISIKGYVWVDTAETKTKEYNSVYDSASEKRVEGVTVNLVNKSNKKVLATTKTDANGEYLFNKVLSSSQLADYYVEFNYNGIAIKTQDLEGNYIDKDISKFIPVAFKADKNGSKALMDSVPYEDEKLSGIASTYKGKGDGEKKYGLSGDLYNTLMEGSVLNNINLGIKEIPNESYNLQELLDYVKIRIKGYDYTYYTGLEGNTQYVGAPKVNIQNEGTIDGYGINIYPSDIAYHSENSEEELHVDVGYIIRIENTAKIGVGDAEKKLEELYKEKALHITSLTDSFDTYRYKLNDSNWTEKDGTATINEDYLKDIKEEGISVDKPAIKKIKFSVNRPAILDILKHPNGIYEQHPTTAHTTGYHEYSRKDYGWNYNISKEQLHRTKDESRDYSAPYLVFKLGDDRVIRGKVFEDGIVTTNGEKLGNGQYNDNENVVEGVKVELLDATGNVSNLYPRAEVIKDMNSISIKAEVTTNENGEFELAGLVPGHYFLRFTYGNGTYKITDIDGNLVDINVESKIDNNIIEAKDYKSTIITNDVIRKALQVGDDLAWYKKIGNTNSSVAIDNLDSRIAVNNGTSSVVMARTAMIDITIENTPENEYKFEVSNNGTVVELTKNVFEGLNFGVIEMPEQIAKLQKVITKIRLVDANGNLLLEGNPEKDTMKGVTDLDNTENGGSSYLRAELQDKMISGGTLTLTYNIKLTNTSDVNYYNNEYYWFGDKKDGKKEVTLKIKDFIDYLDKTLEYNETGSDSRLVLGSAEGETDAELAQKTIIKAQNLNEVLYTEKNKERNYSEAKTSDEFVLVARRENLSMQDEDMEYINRVRVIADNSTDLRDTDTSDSDKEKQVMKYKPIDLKAQADALEQARAIITPPTGADRLTIIIYTIAGTLALAVLSAGVVVIKKYIVK